MKQKLMVVCGGQSSEHIVSRMSCTSVMNNLNKENYDVTLVGIDQDGSWYILDQNQEDLAKDTWLENAKAFQDVFGLLKQQDVVLPILHGAFGEDGTIQGLFELAGVPYVGCRVLASAVSMDKIYTKKILETAGIPQVKSLYVKKRYDGKLVVVNKQFDEIEDIEKTVEEELGFPWGMICPTRETIGSSFPKTAVSSSIQSTHSSTTIWRSYFESKYEDEESKTCIPALVDQEIQDKIREYALRVFKAVDGHGLSRVDFFLDKKSNQIYLNEINTLPGFTKISMYPQLMNDFGISYSELLDRVIKLAFDK